MTEFNENFCTDNFDQEMGDFIKENFKGDTHYGNGLLFYSSGDGVTVQCFLSAIDVANIEDDKDYEETAYIVLKSLDNLKRRLVW